MNWNTDIPEVPASSQPHVPLVGEYMSLSYISLGSNGNSKTNMSTSAPLVLNYGNN